MPANLTPEYKKADEWFRSASSDDEKILALEEMLRTIPKHKGTEHMRADLKKRLSKLRAVPAGGKKAGAKHVDVFHVPKTGAGQIAMVGMPNCGKSSIVGALTKAKVNIADYPFATDKPVPGMMMFEDVQIELVDTPPITVDYAAGGQVGTYRGCDIVAIVIDLAGEVLEQMEVVLSYLESHHLLIDETTEATDASGNALGKKTFVICTKCDIAAEGTMETLKELCDKPFEFIEISAQTGQGLDKLAELIYRLLDIVRIYAKKPGKPVDMKDPFTLSRGSTVTDLACKVHRELAEKLKTARAWGAEGVHDGQNVPRDHVLADKEIIELHFS
ncbi:MAG: 50S ribosome-binding GTPase [Planctomycetes bacterium]|nr:50S ribosome-binding GTPase [Planctomycetota bacterium]